MTRKTSAFIIGIFSLLLLGCQRDDICPEGTQTTPQLLIEFYSAEDSQTLRVVEDLVIVYEETSDTLLTATTTNNIAIPLRTDQSFTEYRFITNSGSENENADLLRFSYNPSPSYLNRACGFKMNFLDLSVSLDSASQGNWIISSFVNIEDIENDTETHISFTH